MPRSISAIHRPIVFATITLALLLPAQVWSQPTSGPAKPPATQPVREDIYDMKADAKAQIAAAAETAKRENQRVLVMFGGNWCGWCHKLHNLFKSDEGIAKTLRYEDLKIDVDRMTNTKSLVERLRKEREGGIPWFVFLDAQGQALATSDGPKGNIGYPVAPEEISHFIGMLKKTAKRITAEQIGQIEKALADPSRRL